MYVLPCVCSSLTTSSSKAFKNRECVWFIPVSKTEMFNGCLYCSNTTAVDVHPCQTMTPAFLQTDLLLFVAVCNSGHDEMSAEIMNNKTQDSQMFVVEWDVMCKLIYFEPTEIHGICCSYPAEVKRSFEEKETFHERRYGCCCECSAGQSCQMVMLQVVSMIIFVLVMYEAPMYEVPNRRILPVPKRQSCEDSVKVKLREIFCNIMGSSRTTDVASDKYVSDKVFDTDGEDNAYIIPDLTVSCFESCKDMYNSLTCKSSSYDWNKTYSGILSHLHDIRKKYIPVQQLIVYPLVYAVNGYLNHLMNDGNLPQDEHMCYEVGRLQSFSSVQIIASPIRLAQSGFYATGSGDETRCYSCRRTHRNWRMMDHPDWIHRSISPDCPHLNRRDPRNMPISNSEHDERDSAVFGVVEEYHVSGASDTVTSRPDSIAAASIVTETTATAATTTPTEATSVPDLDISSAVYPQYRDLASRLDSYRGWEWSHVQDPQILASAGFYYAGYRDCVRCFYCGVGLRTWEREDDPWVEHVRWRSSCDYVRLTRGEHFAIQALANNPPAPLVLPVPSETTQTQTQVQHSRQVVVADGMDVVGTAEEMGFQRELIERAMAELRGSQNTDSSDDPIQLDTLLEKLIVTENAQTTPSVSQSLPLLVDTSSSLGSSAQPMSLTSSGEHHNTERTSMTTLNMGTSSERSDDSISASATSQKAVEGRQEEGATNESGKSQKATGDTGVLSANQERQLEEENQSLRDESTCKICLDNPSCIVFLPCGHLVTCAECAPALRKCPICRAFIRGSVRAHTVSSNN